ncbi:hypothetical protein OEZ86_003180 [Tetradesmus obliquus]|nr:hypothetical protein OEZ86_003180 [Tetradesmus obliquus]
MTHQLVEAGVLAGWAELMLLLLQQYQQRQQQRQQRRQQQRQQQQRQQQQQQQQQPAALADYRALLSTLSAMSALALIWTDALPYLHSEAVTLLHAALPILRQLQRCGGLFSAASAAAAADAAAATTAAAAAAAGTAAAAAAAAAATAGSRPQQLRHGVVVV